MESAQSGPRAASVCCSSVPSPGGSVTVTSVLLLFVLLRLAQPCCWREARLHDTQRASERETIKSFHCSCRLWLSLFPVQAHFSAFTACRQRPMPQTPKWVYKSHIRPSVLSPSNRSAAALCWPAASTVLSAEVKRLRQQQTG